MAARHKILQRRIAARMLKCGASRIWMAPDAKLSAAITRADVRRLIKKGAISKLPEAGTGPAGKRRYQRAGSRKGAGSARQGRKDAWFKVIRPQRKLLAELKPRLAPLAYRKVYRMVKGGAFRSRAHLQTYLEGHGMIVKKK